MSPSDPKNASSVNGSRDDYYDRCDAPCVDEETQGPLLSWTFLTINGDCDLSAACQFECCMLRESVHSLRDHHQTTTILSVILNK